MTDLRTARPTVQDRRARAAVAALFLTNGALFANILPRYPEIKDALGIDNAVYGLAISSYAVGAIIAGLAAAALMRRFGSARVAVFGTIATALGVVAAGSAPSAWLFALGLLVAGGTDAITDVAQNEHGLQVQRRYGRSIINSFHAVWSIGAVLGGSMSAAAIALHVPLIMHLTISAVIFAAVSLTALRYCLPTDRAVDDATSRSTAVRRHGSSRAALAVLALVLIAIAGTIVEDIGNSWASLYLSDSLRAPATIAATGYIALVGAQFLGRLVGDRLIDRFGQRAVVRTGALVAAIGMGIAVAFPSIPGSIAGFAAAGLGVATLVPVAMQAADDLPGLRPGTGVTLVSWLMRIGFLMSPPVVGLIADNSGLRIGLLIVPAVGLMVALLAGVLAGRRPADRDAGAPAS